MSALLDHLAATAPADELVGFAVRHLREPASAAGDQYRGLGPFYWLPARRSAELVERLNIMLSGGELAKQWRWLWAEAPFGTGTPQLAALRRHLHGERVPGALQVRPVTCATRPANGGGTFGELTGVLGLPIDLDVAERRDGDRRGYCPTIAEGCAFLERFGPSVLIDAGGGLLAVWLFDSPAEPRAARQLGRDLHEAIARAAGVRGWAFDSPAPHAAWCKVPGTFDQFNRHAVVELGVGAPWRFDELRAAVPIAAVRPRRWHYAGAEAAL